MPEYTLPFRAKPDDLEKARRNGVWPPLFEHDGGPDGVVTVPVELRIKWGRL